MIDQSQQRQDVRQRFSRSHAGRFSQLSQKRSNLLKNTLDGGQERSARCSRARPFLWPVALGGRRAAACASFFGLRPSKASSRFTFCPEAISKASLFTFSSLCSRNLLIPCHSL